MIFTESLRHNFEFLRAYRRGKSIVAKSFVLYYLKNRTTKNRLGITASKKIGNAVQRNRARRMLKETYRLLENNLKSGYDIVLVARKRLVNENQRSVQEQVRKELQRLELWNNDL